MYFYLFFAKRQDQSHIEKREPMKHKVPFKEATFVKIHVNQDVSLSESAYILNKLSNLSIEQDKENLIELEFDNMVLNQFKDFIPELPLLFKW